MTELLNTAQRSRLAIVLRELEISLRQADEWLDHFTEQAGVLYRFSLRLPAGRRALVRRRIARALQRVVTLAQELDLDAVDEDLAGRIAAEMSAHWSALIDSRSATLRRYGDVHPELAAIIDQPLEQLAEDILMIARWVKLED